jgi:hypothetical protein
MGSILMGNFVCPDYCSEQWDDTQRFCVCSSTDFETKLAVLQAAHAESAAQMFDLLADSVAMQAKSDAKIASLQAESAAEIAALRAEVDALISRVKVLDEQFSRP